MVLNVCALLPFWVLALGWLPDQIKIYLPNDGKSFVSVLSGDGELLGTAYGGTRETQVWHFHLNRESTLSQLTFRVSGCQGKSIIRKIEWQKWHFFAFSLDLDSLEHCNEDNSFYVFLHPRVIGVALASRNLALGMGILQLLFCVVAWLAARFRRHFFLQSSFLPAFSAATVFALVWHVLLPLQTYWGNLSAFPFTLSELLPDLGVRFVAFIAAGTVALAFLDACFGRWVSWMLWALALGFHLESGLLSFGLPPMNGDWIFYTARPRAVWDALIWISLFVGAAFLQRSPSKTLPLASAVLAAWMGLSLFDIRHERAADGSKLLVSNFRPLSEIPDTLVYSSRGNVLVFVLDSLEREQAHAAIYDEKDGSALRDAFRGFTECADNLGALSSSGFSVANMFTGKRFEAGGSTSDYFMSVYSPDSVLKDYLDAGWNVHLSTASIGAGYSNRPLRPGTESHAPPPQLDAPDRPMRGSMPWSLSDICRFRAMPFAFRFKYLYVLSRELPSYSFMREWNLYPRLAEAPAEQNIPGTLLFVHTEGVHVPVMYDRSGTLLPVDRNTDSGCVDMAIFLLRQLAALFAAYEKSGIYDNSLILVLADHGNHVNNARTLPVATSPALPGNARPFLWVKPPFARHPFRSSAVPTSHVRISRLLRQALRIPSSETDIPGLLRMDERWYQFIPDFGLAFDDWTIHSDGSCLLNGKSILLSSPP